MSVPIYDLAAQPACQPAQRTDGTNMQVLGMVTQATLRTEEEKKGRDTDTKRAVSTRLD